MWKKKGLIFKIENYINEFIKSHGSIPFAHHVKDNLFRIYFSSRNENGKSLPYYIDALVFDSNIKIIGDVSEPLLQLGELGSFDDSGIMPSCIVKNKEQLFMYYIGWNPQVTVSYRLSIGLAVSNDDGKTFIRYSKGPICDRALNEPYFNTAPYVLLEKDKWRMWYISCTSWKIINNYPEPAYHIKYAESLDGINWKREGVVCLDYDEKAEALGRPCVVKEEHKYRMYFSYRKINRYRELSENGYKIGLAQSEDGIHWIKEYDNTKIELSKNGWDNKMMEYCHVFNHKGVEYMLYNGNNFGKEGFGYAVK